MEHSVMNEHPRPNSRLSTRTFDGETVIVDPNQNVVRLLNEVGSRIWALADGTRTIEQIAARLCEEFDVAPATASREVAVFLNDLDQRGLLA